MDRFVSPVLWQFLVKWLHASALFPAEASGISPYVDALYFFLLLMTVVGTSLVALLLLTFCLRYRREKNPVATQIEGSTLLEATWTIIPLAIFLLVFVWGALLYFRIYDPPTNAMNIYVVGKQWMWKAEHPGGQHEINALHVPTGRPVQLTMISQDVFHSFSIPDFRVKREVIPGRYSTVWFEATEPGTYHLFCTQYCGTQHSRMIGEVTVLTPDDYKKWLDAVHQRHEPRAERRAALRQHGLQRLPQRQRRGARAEPRRRLRLQAHADRRQPGAGERRLPARRDPEPVAACHRRVCAHHADLPGADQRRRPDRSGRVHQDLAVQLPGAADADDLAVRSGCTHNAHRGHNGNGEAMSPSTSHSAPVNHTILSLPDQSTAKMPKRNYLNNEHGLLSWLLTGDHKRIAILYLISITFFFFIGGAFAGLIRLELLTPQPDLVAADTYNKFFTMHGIIMIFLFLVPSVPATLGNFLIPIMLGAKDLAFPKINLLSWYLYLAGGTLTLAALVLGGVDTGWTFTTPLSTHYLNTHVITAATAIFIAGFSSIFTGLNFIVTIHRMRCPGMTWFRMPLFVWSHYAAIAADGARHAGAGHRDGAGRAGAHRRHRRLRPHQGRRSAALPASLLVLLAPGRLHHDSARHGRHLRGHLAPSAASASSAIRPSRSARSPSRSSASSSGSTTCSSWVSPTTRRWSSRC